MTKSKATILKADGLKSAGHRHPNDHQDFSIEPPHLFCKVRLEKQDAMTSYIILTHADKGLIFAKDLTGKLKLSIGTAYEMSLFLPGRKQTFSFRISYIQGSFFTIYPLSENKKLQKDIGQFLFNTLPHMTPEKIRRAGFSLYNIKQGVKTSMVKGPHDLEKVADLRHLAYQQKYKKQGIKAHLEPTDAYDERSKIIIITHFDRVIASLRFIQNTSGDISEHEAFQAYPKMLPDKNNVIEITRVCTHPEYRRCGLLAALFIEASKQSILDHREYLLGSSTGKLLDLYKGMGFKTTGLKYRHKTLGDMEHEVFYGKKNDLITGNGVSPIVWHKLYSEAFYLAASMGYPFSFSFKSYLKLLSYRCLHRFLELKKLFSP